MKESTYELKWNGTTFKIGQRVQTTSNSDYAGLSGVILEIHTGEDKETDNLTPDIHCSFDFPESEAEIQKLEERFSSLYNMPKKLDELALDEVIMSPNELILIPEEPTRLLHYIGTDEWARPVYQQQFLGCNFLHKYVLADHESLLHKADIPLHLSFHAMRY